MFAKKTLILLTLITDFIIIEVLSIIIPSYKSAGILRNQLPGFINHLKKNYPDNFEVLVIDDGSDDNGETKAVAEELGCRFFANPINMGKGAAVKNGMLNAIGEYRIFTDADIPFEYSNIDNFYTYLSHKEFDVVIGDRGLPESKYFNEISKKRKLGSSIFTFFVGRFVTTGIPDTQCGLKGFKAKVAEDIFSKACIKGFAFDVEAIYIALKRNYDIKRLPVVLRSTEGSSVSLLKHSLGMLRDLLKIKINHMTRKYNINSNG